MCVTDTDGFTETGGAAALVSAGSHLDAVFTTLGSEAERKFRMGDVRLAAKKIALMKTMMRKR